ARRRPPSGPRCHAPRGRGGPLARARRRVGSSPPPADSVGLPVNRTGCARSWPTGAGTSGAPPPARAPRRHGHEKSPTACTVGLLTGSWGGSGLPFLLGPGRRHTIHTRERDIGRSVIAPPSGGGGGRLVPPPRARRHPPPARPARRRGQRG